MVARDDIDRSVIREIREELRAIRTKVNAGFSSITRGALRIASNEGLLVEGSAKVSGWLVVTGTGRVVGRLEGSGSLDWTGPSWLRGGSTVEGTLRVTDTAQLVGDTTIDGSCRIRASLAVDGPATLNSDLTLGTGRIVVGNLVIQKSASYSAELASSGILYLRGAGIRFAGPAVTETHLTVLGDLDVIGAKNFRMPHPTKPDMWLRHGSTESPVSGTEYTGRVTLDENGEGVITLPDYFEALNKPEGRTVQLTPVGRPFPVGADEVLNGEVRVYGDAGRDVFWLVKAERFGGDFLLEEQIPRSDAQ